MSNTMDDFSYLDQIDWSDEAFIEPLIGNKRKILGKDDLKDLSLEYAISSRDICRECTLKITKGEVQITEKYYVDERTQSGFKELWHHVTCFAELRHKFGFWKCGDTLPGFQNLNETDKKEVLEHLPAIKQGSALDSKRVKTEEHAMTAFNEILEQQNSEMLTMRNLLRENLSKTKMMNLLEENDQVIPAGIDRILDRLSDMMVFGQLLPCPRCRTGQFVPTGGGYICTGDLTEWTKCQNKIKDPLRVAVNIPHDLAEAFHFLKTYKFKYRCRVFREDNNDIVGSSIPFDIFPSTSNSTTTALPSTLAPIITKKTQTLKIKHGTAVDPDSGLMDKKAHVYIDTDGIKYTTVLGLTDIQRQKNSFYKIQVVQADRGKGCWLFRSWGQIGTTTGGKKTERYTNIELAKQRFCEVFLLKSGNDWNQRELFEKMPGRMYPIDVDYGEDDSQTLGINTEYESTLPKEVQNLVKMIFNVKNMQKLMEEFEMDLEKMPLGKLSKLQIRMAYRVLTELQELITNNGTDSQFIEASNRFYTFIPHTFVNVPTVIKEPNLIKQKIDMLDNLVELEVAYKLMKSTGGRAGIDSYYGKLNTKLEVLPKDSLEFDMLSRYVRNTHGGTHTQFNLEIKNAFTVQREGEAERFKPSTLLRNRQLLWHGSRTTNFAGILSQGLRIAPPEAPSSGYMFGKGIYFADMVTKSAQYCWINPGSTGLLLLCDVALGTPLKLTQAQKIEKLTYGYHSVTGLGKCQPDRAKSEYLPGAVVEVPLGMPKQRAAPGCVLAYNEYIVYNPAQVNIKYLIEMKFKRYARQY